jgi:hypothetical protein
MPIDSSEVAARIRDPNAHTRMHDAIRELRRACEAYEKMARLSDYRAGDFRLLSALATAALAALAVETELSRFGLGPRLSEDVTGVVWPSRLYQALTTLRRELRKARADSPGWGTKAGGLWAPLPEKLRIPKRPAKNPKFRNLASYKSPSLAFLLEALALADGELDGLNPRPSSKLLGRRHACDFVCGGRSRPGCAA